MRRGLWGRRVGMAKVIERCGRKKCPYEDEVNEWLARQRK